MRVSSIRVRQGYRTSSHYTNRFVAANTIGSHIDTGPGLAKALGQKALGLPIISYDQNAHAGTCDLASSLICRGTDAT